jgi:hypothetical protein
VARKPASHGEALRTFGATLWVLLSMYVATDLRKAKRLGWSADSVFYLVAKPCVGRANTDRTRRIIIPPIRQSLRQFTAAFDYGPAITSPDLKIEYDRDVEECV